MDNNNNPHKTRKVSAQIVTAYRISLGRYRLPLDPELFAIALNRATALMSDLQPGFTITPQTVLDWTSGTELPNPVYLVTLRNLALEGTWLVHFANDLLAARFPDEFEPTGPIGKWMNRG